MSIRSYTPRPYPAYPFDPYGFDRGYTRHRLPDHVYALTAQSINHPGNPAGLPLETRKSVAAVRHLLDSLGLEVSVQRKAPTFKPGDVLVVRHDGPNSTGYTYVRGAANWPGDRAAAKTDAQMTALWREGKAVLKMRGGESCDNNGERA